MIFLGKDYNSIESIILLIMIITVCNSILLIQIRMTVMMNAPKSVLLHLILLFVAVNLAIIFHQI